MQKLSYDFVFFDTLFNQPLHQLLRTQQLLLLHLIQPNYVSILLPQTVILMYQHCLVNLILTR